MYHLGMVSYQLLGEVLKKDRLYLLQNSGPHSFYKYIKPIRNTIFNFDRLFF